MTDHFPDAGNMVGRSAVLRALADRVEAGERIADRLEDAHPATQDMEHTMQGGLMREAAATLRALVRERDALLKVARAAGDVLHYGNAFAAGERTMLDVLDEALDALPTGMLDQSR